MDSLAGHFLIASPAIMDPNFERAVVLITAHNDEGAIGLILNRCSEATVGEAVPQLAPVIDMDEPVFVGGPVNPDGVAVLAEFDDPGEAGIVVLDDVGFVAMEDELERDDWIVEPANVDAIFTDDPDKLWSEVLRRKGGRYELVARMPIDPSMN